MLILVLLFAVPTSQPTFRVRPPVKYVAKQKCYNKTLAWAFMVGGHFAEEATEMQKNGRRSRRHKGKTYAQWWRLWLSKPKHKVYKYLAYLGFNVLWSGRPKFYLKALKSNARRFCR